MNTVLICGGEINDEFSLVCLKQIKPDCIIGVDKGLEFCYRNHVIPDWILGDFDSISKEVIDWYREQQEIPIRQYKPEKDDTDTYYAARKALELLPDYEKAAHTALFEAEGGVFPDWNAVNHHRTIAFYQDFITRWHDAYITEIEEFCDCVATGRKATPGVIDGTQSTKIAFRCKESFLTDKKLTLE